MAGLLLAVGSIGSAWSADQQRPEKNTWNLKSWGDKRPDFSKKSKKKSEPIPPGSPFLYNDILLGLKGGFRVTGYTFVTVDGQSKPRTSGLGYTLGASFFWALGWPRLEMDALILTRKQGDRTPVGYVGLPILFKFAPIENKLFAWHLGAGFQPDIAITGGGARRGVLLGMPLATDLSIDLGVYLTFELRYTFGLLTYDTDTSGGRPRDLDMMFGLSFPIDRPEPPEPGEAAH